MAIRHRTEHNIAVMVSFIPANAALLADVVQQEGSIFADVIRFDQFSGLSKRQQRLKRTKVLQTYLATHPATRLFTGTDRNVEFQYAMHLARKHNPDAKGIYLDEGTQTYLGNKHMHKIQHRFIDPMLKKLVYGHWWKNPLIIGTSDWIDEVYAAFPALVHPLFAGKNIQPFDSIYFNDAAFHRISALLMAKVALDAAKLTNIDCVVLLTGDSFYQDAQAHVSQLMQVVGQRFAAERIAIKAHPRSAMLASLKQRYPDCMHLDNRVGFELMLPLLPEHCVFIGDFTSTLFTIKWFKPQHQVYSVNVRQASPSHFETPLRQLFSNVQIPQLSYQQLADTLSASARTE